MPGVLLRIAYVGTHFHGWAPQTEQRTVAGAVNNAIAAMMPPGICSAVRGASRTDTGVHAKDQVAAFDSRQEIPPKGWVLGINQRLPRDVAIQSAASVEEGFEPRFRNIGKHYSYRIRYERVRDPFSEDLLWRVTDTLNVERMLDEAQAFKGEHGFGAFHAARDERTSFTRTIDRIELVHNAPDLVIHVYGKAFLYNMVRIMVGTLVDVGRGHREPGTVQKALTSQLRTDAGVTAPAQGLMLETIELDVSEADRWPARSKHGHALAFDGKTMP
jgi:tRNA pseudouridine38-40 synthase